MRLKQWIVIASVVLVACGRESQLERRRSLVAPSNVDAHVFFTGLCTFLRRPSLPIVAYMPRVDNERRSEYDPGDQTLNIPIHAPFIVIDRSKYNFASATLTPQYVGAFAIFWLDDLDLEVLDASGDAVTWNETDSNDACPMLAAGDMHSIPHVGTFCDATGSPMKNDPNVRVQMRKGTTAAYVVDNNTWKFKTKNDAYVDYERRLAQVVDWAVPINNSSLVFTAASIKGGGAHTHLLTVYPDSKGRVVVAIGNASKADLVASLKRQGVPMDKDSHFEVYYDRCTKTTGKPIPHKSGNCPADDPLPTWMPDWLKQHGAIPGSVNCGPDQWP